MKPSKRLCTPTILTQSEKATTALLYTIMAGCCVLGSGQVISFGGLGLRMLLLGVLMVLSLPLVIAQWRQLVRNPLAQLTAVFLVWLAVSTVVGILNRNSMSNLIGDLKGFCYFAFLIPALCVLNSSKRIKTLMKVLMYSSGLLALLHLGTLAAYLIDPFKTEWFLLELLQSHLGWLDKISYTMTRLFYRSVVYLICGCGFSLYFYVFEDRKLRYPILAGLCLFGILLSYTRSIYLGLAVAALLCAGYILIRGNATQRKRLLVFVAVMLLVFLLVTAGFSLSQQEDYLGFAFSRVFSISYTPAESNLWTLSAHPLLGSASLEDYLQSSKDSDILREQTIAEMLAKIQESPIFGSGLGVKWTVRTENGGLSEYFYLDLLAKTGIIGLFLYLSPILYTLYLWIRKGSDPAKWIWMAVLFGFLTVSYFNPYMNSALGILFYCCCIAVFCVKKPQAQSNI